MKNKIIFFLIFLVLIFQSEAKNKKGKLLIIGGGDETEEILREFINLAGGEKSKIVIIPTASSIPDTVAAQYEALFKKYKANAFSLKITKEEANDEKKLIKLKNITGVFFTGGDQTRLASTLIGTKLLEKIKNIYLTGGVIAGTSAGAAVMSKIMITGNEILNKDTTQIFFEIKKGNIETAEGFGFIENAIIDQHFIARKRHNRLISAVLENPELIGIGIDESTAIIVRANNSFKVIGKNLVVIYDATNAKNIYQDLNGNQSAQNIKMTILKSGDEFKIKK